jgi:multisubunit Na+/H+ antiporter MnhC subunit
MGFFLLLVFFVFAVIVLSIIGLGILLLRKGIIIVKEKHIEKPIIVKPRSEKILLALLVFGFFLTPIIIGWAIVIICIMRLLNYDEDAELELARKKQEKRSQIKRYHNKKYGKFLIVLGSAIISAPFIGLGYLIIYNYLIDIGWI